MLIVCPVIYFALLLARYPTMLEISSTSPNFCIGIQFIIASFCLSDKTSTVSVLIYPGVIVFTVMFLVATSFASAKVNPLIAALDAL